MQRALVSGGPYVTVGCPATTSYTDTGLTNGTTYYYVVAGAYTGDPDAGGGSAASPEASATPQNLPLTSIAVTPSNQTLTVGGTQQFTATGTYSDGSTQNLTSQVTWASSNTAAATINATGLATAAAAGTTTISATLGAVSGSTGLTVTSGPLTITTTALPAATAGVAYSATLAATGGTPPYTWSTRERHAARGTGPSRRPRRDLGNANGDRDLQLHRQGRRRGAERHQGPQHHGELRRPAMHLADQPDARPSSTAAIRTR